MSEEAQESEALGAKEKNMRKFDYLITACLTLALAGSAVAGPVKCESILGGSKGHCDPSVERKPCMIGTVAGKCMTLGGETVAATCECVAGANYVPYKPPLISELPLLHTTTTLSTAEPVKTTSSPATVTTTKTTPLIVTKPTTVTETDVKKSNMIKSERNLR
jgi:hypothetical protein